MNESQLTERQTRFIREYLVDGNGTRAAIAAGYGRAGAHVTACRTLLNPKVKAAIAARQAGDVARLRIDRDRAVAELLQAATTAKEQQNPAAMVVAWREIGRMLGLYPAARSTVAVGAKPVVDHPFEKMSDEALAVLAAQG